MTAKGLGEARLAQGRQALTPITTARTTPITSRRQCPSPLPTRAYTTK